MGQAGSCYCISMAQGEGLGVGGSHRVSVLEHLAYLLADFRAPTQLFGANNCRMPVLERFEAEVSQMQIMGPT